MTQHERIERLMTQDEVLKRLCQLTTRVARDHYQHERAADCFCGQSVPNPLRTMWMMLDGGSYRFDEDVLLFIESAVNAALSQKQVAEVVK